MWLPPDRALATIDRATFELPPLVRDALMKGTKEELEEALLISIQEAVAAAVADFDGDTPGFDIFLLWGQSNMSGRGTPYSLRLDPPNSKIKQWRTTGTLGIQEAREPLNMHDVASGIGPGLQFARWYAARRLESGRQVLLVPAAHGGTQLSTNETPLGWRRGVAGNLYANGIQQAQAALAAANAIEGTVNRIMGVLWLQGETDGTNNVSGPTYQTDLDANIVGSRTDLGEPNLPWVIGTMVPEYLSVGTRIAIDAVHRDTPARLPYTDVAISAVNMNKGDGNHFNGAGSRFNGKAMFDAYERIAEGLAPYSATDTSLGPVTGVTVAATSAQVLTVSWTALPGVTSYRVDYQEPNSSSWIAVGTTTGTSLAVGALLGNTDYGTRVVPLVGASEGTASEPIFRTTPAEVVVVSDSFNRADGSLGTPDVGPAWQTVLGTFNVSGNQGMHGGTANSQALVEAGRADAIIRLKYATLDRDTSTSTRMARMIWRADGTVNNYWLVQYRSAANQYQLYKYVNNGAAGAVVLSASPADGDVLSVSTTGDTHAIRLNGVLIYRFQDAHNIGATKYGFGGGGSNVPRYDDFKVSY